jgi:AGCS family alanine or glycine:cation symporter
MGASTVSSFVWHAYLSYFQAWFYSKTHFQSNQNISFTRKNEGDGDISHFGSLMTALAATIGTGNIVGVATAIVSGGPGAVLWMWLTGVFGISTYGCILCVRLFDSFNNWL